MRSRRIVSGLVAAVALFAPGCGGGGDGPGVITGRVMSISDASVCVSPDRGETQSCVARGVAPDAIEVGQCAIVTLAPTPDAAQLEVVDEAACAAGDLGDDEKD